MYYEQIQNKKRTYLELIPNEKNEAFVFRKFYDKKIYDFRHIHDEIEIIYIHKGKGKRNIGDISCDFIQGNVCLIAPKVPHFYIINPTNGDNKVEVWVIQFSINFFGSAFYDYNEILQIRNIILNSYKGIYFTDIANKSLVKYFQEISQSSGINKITIFLKMLNYMATIGNYIPIEGLENNTFNDNEIHKGDRLNHLYSFLQTHYTSNIELNEVAGIIGLSKSALCNLFKKHFHTTFSDYLNGLRINRAAQILNESDLPISEISYKVGYQNLSYFNRKFKKILNLTPRQYRKQLSEKGITFKPGIEF